MTKLKPSTHSLLKTARRFKKLPKQQREFVASELKAFRKARPSTVAKSKLRGSYRTLTASKVNERYAGHLIANPHLQRGQRGKK